MPVYQGGKARIGKEISEVIQKYEKKHKWKGDFFEPFCGLLGVGINFAKQKRKVYACDKNEDLILMWQALQKGWNPPITCSKEKFDKLKKSTKHSAERGFIGIGCAYNGIFLCGYRTQVGDRNYLQCFLNGINKYKKYLNNIEFLNAANYDEFEPEGFTIYCDPPYKDNGYKTDYFQNFNHSEFWELMRKWSKKNLVFVSEYTAPKDFKCIWKKDNFSMHNGLEKRKKEKLYTLI